MTDSAPPKRLACIACTRAKRKCSKQTPSCHRCAAKKVVCRYPAPRVAPPYDFVFSQDGAVSVIPIPDTADRHPLPTPPSQVGEQQQQQQQAEEQPQGQTELSPSAHGARAAADSLKDPWFLSPSSWDIDHRHGPIPSQIYFSDEALTYFIDQLRGWLRQWTTEGHCPFIHQQLWRIHLPDNIQDAFTSLAAYNSKTPATEKTVLRIIESRVNNLVDTQHASSVGDFGVIMLDPACHLARTQALLIYKIIRLFDGDIRARAQAEKNIDTLALWARQLWQSAGLALSSSSHKELSSGPVGTQLRTDGTLTSTWQAWIFSESIRRTYLAATLTEAVYLTLKQGWSPCPGGIVFSGGAGLWDATSPFAWVKRYQENAVNSIRCIDGEQLFSSAKASDVDEFCQATMIVSYGLERFDRWRNEMM
ncbi:hypothetical protein BBK36DRAFT_17098 [Trichoderma citrinoviride]|uniref:Zn(2)-C6 fungal-type domain-containing protein n=1 Tax=Trichoderma citrinoviride TaxID=58853 RepID=A0A2T4BK86_9HYPO|nr:hypothetical protein BBK36DRAFT_17098 [Trichoderma citrinoviride]PTB69722.1 hypothetical protein BBK36DRAFT_17098 [Trichoderma citrinoviride]